MIRRFIVGALKIGFVVFLVCEKVFQFLRYACEEGVKSWQIRIEPREKQSGE